MSAEELRNAAVLMREEFTGFNCGDCGIRGEFVTAVAEWLEDAAENLDMQAPDGELRKHWDMRVHINGDKALAVARAYRDTT